MKYEELAEQILEIVMSEGAELVTDWHGGVWVIAKEETRPKNGDVDDDYRGAYICGG